MRPDTQPRRNDAGTTTRRVKRACNGCGNTLGDATDAELDAAMAGRELPDVRGECPSCTPAS